MIESFKGRHWEMTGYQRVAYRELSSGYPLAREKVKHDYKAFFYTGTKG
jgi:hypothetical protein